MSKKSAKEKFSLWYQKIKTKNQKNLKSFSKELEKEIYTITTKVYQNHLTPLIATNLLLNLVESKTTNTSIHKKPVESIEKEIEKLYSEHDYKIMLLNKIPKGLKFTPVYTSEKNKFVSIHCENLESVVKILELFPSITNEVKFNETVIFSKYRFTIKNPIKGIQTVKITYSAKETEVWITFPAIFINPFISKSTRKVYSEEYHYFPGKSREVIHSMQIAKYIFKDHNMFWYGGDCDLIDPKKIEEIISFIYNESKSKSN